MLMLPPIAPAGRAERRVRARRSADRAAKAAADATIDAPFAPEAPDAASQAELERRRPRRGRRASDKRSEPDGAGDARIARAPKPHAPLVAQLIAQALGVEQTRARRRATLAEAEALYKPRRERAKRSRGEY